MPCRQNPRVGLYALHQIGYGYEVVKKFADSVAVVFSNKSTNSTCCYEGLRILFIPRLDNHRKILLRVEPSKQQQFDLSKKYFSEAFFEGEFQAALKFKAVIY